MLLRFIARLIAGPPPPTLGRWHLKDTTHALSAYTSDPGYYQFENFATCDRKTSVETPLAQGCPKNQDLPARALDAPRS